LNENINKNLKELKTLEKVPELMDSSNKEREALIQNLSKFKGLDGTILSLEEEINKLEPLHNKYLQASRLRPNSMNINRKCWNLKIPSLQLVLL